MSTPVASDTRFMRQVNSAAVLTQLRWMTSTSVSVLARTTGLSRQALTSSMAGLQEAGLVDFLAPERSGNRSGRPPQIVRFRAEVGCVFGVSVTPEELRVGVADLAGTVVADETEALAGSSVVEVLTATVTRALDAVGVIPQEVWHVPDSAPGMVDQVTRNIQFTPSMPHIVEDVLLRARREQFSYPPYLENDVELATEGERWRAALERTSRSEQVPLVTGAPTADNPAAREEAEVSTRRSVPGPEAVRALSDPELVVIGGQMAQCGDALLTTLARHLRHLGDQRLNPPRLELSCLGDDAVVQGALHHSLTEVECDALRPPKAGCTHDRGSRRRDAPSPVAPDPSSTGRTHAHQKT